MKKTGLVLLGLWFLAGFLWPEEGPISREAYAEAKIELAMDAKNVGLALSKLILMVPLPEDSIEQEVGEIDLDGGTLLRDGSSGNAYAEKLSVGEALPRAGSSAGWRVRYRVTMYKVKVDFGSIGKPKEYDTGSDLYRKNTGDYLPYIDTGNEMLGKVAERLWNKAEGDPIAYARAAYLHVATTYEYLNPDTGLHPLDRLLSQGGGDCGNLGSIYITLLRMKGIPARHVVALRADASFHVWAEFYVQDVGWVPVDPTFKNSDPRGDYFGVLDKRNAGVVVSRGLGTVIELDTTEPYRMALNQNYGYWYWWTSGDGQVRITYSINGRAK